MQNQRPLSVKDLAVEDSYPQFQGIAGQFFENAATYINYAVPANSHITRTPQNKACIAKMQQIVRKIKTPRRCGALGDSLLRNQLQKSTFMDQTANNATVVKDYAIPIISELVQTDAEYLREGLYGDPDYLESVQVRNARKYPVGLVQAPAARAGSGGAAGFQRRSARRSGPGPRAPVAPGEQLTQRDVMKGVDYICQVTYKESYLLETQFFACSLFHRVLSRLQLRRAEVKLCAALCVFEATKHEENYGEALGASALVAYFGEAFTKRQLFEAEVPFMDALDWRLGVSGVNARLYLRTLFRDLGLELKTCVLASYLAEIASLDQRFVEFTAFELALAAVELAVLSFFVEGPAGGQARSVLAQLFVATSAANADAERMVDMVQTQENKAQKKKCRKLLAAQWREVGQKGRATQIFKKYMDPQYYQISLREPIQDVDEAIRVAVDSM